MVPGWLTQSRAKNSSNWSRTVSACPDPPAAAAVAAVLCRAADLAWFALGSSTDVTGGDGKGPAAGGESSGSAEEGENGEVLGDEAAVEAGEC